jgi:hypothetical protein
MIRRPTWIVIGIFLILLLVFVLYQRDIFTFQEEEPTPTVLESRTLFDIDGEDIQGLLIVEAQGNIVHIEKDEGGEWVLREPTAEATDIGAVESTLNQLLTLRVLSTLFEIPSLEVLGLVSPTYTLTIYFVDGNSQIYQVGVLTPTESGYYLQDRNGVVLVVDKFGMETVLNLLEQPPILATPTVESGETEPEAP